MGKVRKFRWPGGESGFDVELPGEEVYRVDGKSRTRSYTWTLEELIGYAENPQDSMTEVTGKGRVEVHSTRVLLIDGEVVDVEDAKALRDALIAGIDEFEGKTEVNKPKPVTVEVDREAKTPQEIPDFPGQGLVTGTWTQEGNGDGWLRVALGLNGGREAEERVYLKLRPHLLRLMLDIHGEDDAW